MAEMVTLTIDGMPVSVPEGTLIVDAAKKIGIDIPVFCYHPKLEPVGMCRMCLVEIGRPIVDRTTGTPSLNEDGSLKIGFNPKLETACTTPVSEGMVVLGLTEKVKAGREDIIEFILTSHPLDCPICDKGGECPLQNLTMHFGPGESRFLYDEKIHLAKNIPLGELIILDRERCIQCGRCVRFQSEIVNEPVIGFSQRGRALEIVSYSEPGFDSCFSGNTTDICPVGALTTVDFRFGARPWELNSAASICNHCPVGCNLTFNVRREAVSGGNWVVKRVMPRQNESVNEIWICDKGRFGYHFADHSSPESADIKRLTQPLVRKNADSNHAGELVPVSWDEALSVVVEKLREAGANLATIASGRLANEDLYSLKQLTQSLDGQSYLYSYMAGGDLTSRIGLTPGSNLGDLGEGDCILVVACDLYEEAPIWWLRLKQAADRGAQVILLNSRQTKLEPHATFNLRYPFGAETSAVLAILNHLSPKRLPLPEIIQPLESSSELKSAAKVFENARNSVIFFGSDGIGLAQSKTLSQACANLLIATGHYNRPNNGLVGVWQRANDQGAWEMGFQPGVDLDKILESAEALYIAAADPVGDNPVLLEKSGIGGKAFILVQDLFLTHTARLADVVLPAQTWLEREGSYTSGERRVQRFYPVTPARTTHPSDKRSSGTSRSPLLKADKLLLEGALPDFAITTLIAERLGLEVEPVDVSASGTFSKLAENNPVFNNLNYQKLAVVTEQWPIVGRGDLYYGGTTYENSQGLGCQLALSGEGEIGFTSFAGSSINYIRLPKLGQIAFPITRLYDQGGTLLHSQLLHQRIGDAYLLINNFDAERLRVIDGDIVQVSILEQNTHQPESGTAGRNYVLPVRVEMGLPERVVLVPRSFGVPIDRPTAVELRRSG